MVAHIILHGILPHVLHLLRGFIMLLKMLQSIKKIACEALNKKERAITKYHNLGMIHS